MAAFLHELLRTKRPLEQRLCGVETGPAFSTTFVCSFDRRVLMTTNDDGGGSGNPWSDAEGYGVQVAMLSDPANTRDVFDLGKRTDLTNNFLLASSGAYTKAAGGNPAEYTLGAEYTLTMDILKFSGLETIITTTLSDAGGVLSTFSVTDDGTALGSAAPYDRFSFVQIRMTNEVETADKFEFTRFRVELSDAASAAVPEPATAILILSVFPFAFALSRGART